MWKLKNLPHWQIIFSAVLFVLSTPPFAQSYLSFVAWVPWILVLKSPWSFRQKLIQSFWLASLITLGSFYWIAYAIPTFGGLPLWVGVVSLLAFSFVCQLQIPLFATVYEFALHRNAGSSKFPRSAWLYGFLASLFYVAIDFSVPKLFKDSIGHHLFNWKSLRQMAEWTGVPGITLIVLMINFSLSQAIEEFLHFEAKKGAFCIKGFLSLLFRRNRINLLILFFACLAGSFRLRMIHNAPVDEWLKAAAIQANIGDIEKIAAETGHRGAADRVIQNYLDLSTEAFQNLQLPENKSPLDFIVWPETAYPATFGTPRTLEEVGRERRIFEWARNHGTPLLFGGYDTIKGKDFNAFFFLNPAQDSPQVYKKTLLLPFGEFMPGADTFDFIRDSFPTVGNFGRGNGPETFTISRPTRQNNRVTDFKFIPAICYEILYSDFILQGVRKNRSTQFILNITNDSWFGNFGEPQSHLALSVFRAIETRLPILRVTNTGITALILPDGSIQEPTELNERLFRIYSIPLYRDQISGGFGLIINTGSWLYFCALATLGLSLFRQWAVRRRGASFRQTP